MRTREAILSVPFFILLAIMLPSGSIDPVSGQLVGLVCLSPSSNPACPAPPVTVTSPVGTQMSVYVTVQGSGGLDGFDITLIANHTIIKPADASLTGSILSGGIIVNKCIGGVLKAGPICAATDTADTIHFAATAPLGSPDTAPPTTALLFTAIYNVTGTTAIPINFQIGCSRSSVSGTTACVLISNGTPFAVPETVQAASYTPAPTPTFAISTSQPQISLFKGETGNASLTLTSLNGFAGSVALSVSVTPSGKHAPLFSFTQGTVNLVSGGSSTSLFIVSTSHNTDRGLYTVTITATGGGASGSIQMPVSVIS